MWREIEKFLWCVHRKIARILFYFSANLNSSSAIQKGPNSIYLCNIVFISKATKNWHFFVKPVTKYHFRQFAIIAKKLFEYFHTKTTH